VDFDIVLINNISNHRSSSLEVLPSFLKGHKVHFVEQHENISSGAEDLKILHRQPEIHEIFLEVLLGPIH
jgi:hypothetical protein